MIESLESLAGIYTCEDGGTYTMTVLEFDGEKFLILHGEKTGPEYPARKLFDNVGVVKFDENGADATIYWRDTVASCGNASAKSKVQNTKVELKDKKFQAKVTDEKFPNFGNFTRQ